MKVRVYTDYEPVRILRGVSGKNFTEPTDALAIKCGLSGAFVEVDESEIPQDRTYRTAWKHENGKIVEDASKVAVIDAKIAQKKVDVLIEEKKKELAVQALKSDGMLDQLGEITASGKLSVDILEGGK